MSFDAKRMIQFEHNVGEKEKKIRLYAGAALVLISIFSAKIFLLLVGLILIATGYSGWCPAYSGFGKNTCEKGEDKPAQTSSAAKATVTEEKKPAAKKPAAKKTAAKKPTAKKVAAKKTTED